MSNVLFCRADFDMATRYLSAYTDKLVSAAIDSGHKVTDLYNSAPSAEVTSENFERYIAEQDILIGAGHGGKNIFTGQDLEILLDGTVNPEVMSGKACYLASCQAGMQLGPTLIQKSAKLFAGYQADWVFVYNADYYEQDRVLEDPYAQPFFDAALVPGYGILAGKSAHEIYAETIARHDYWWDYWKKQDDPIGDSILTWLNWNKESFIVIASEEVYTQKPTLSVEKLVLPIGAVAFLFLLSKIGKK